ncbi:MAG: hypothetical protein WBM35_10460 [Candidatus Electrothrix sp.]
MIKEKKHCWEFAACGLEPGGKNVSTHGICLAAPEQKDNNIHPGLDPGACCRIDPELLYQGEMQTNRLDFLTAPVVAQPLQIG